MSLSDGNGHKYGNFHSYYTFHEDQSRTKLIPQKFFFSLWKLQGEPETFSILDVGCNEGNLTIELYERAVSELPSHVCCRVLGVDLDDILIGRAIKKAESMESVSFCTVDIMKEDQGSGVSVIRDFCEKNIFTGFSFISLFSITMWIHLNHGDIGLEKFLSKGASLLSNVTQRSQKLMTLTIKFVWHVPYACLL
jgi:SAM-dependent methyltransferase